MTAKRYDVIDKEEPRGQSVTYDGIPCTARYCCTNLNRLTEENEELKQYKQAVNEVLLSWSQKNLTAKELEVICALIEELNVKV